ncbi:NPC intracellular cholesterol transporter 2-like [Sabethes cyaneus]|uniref:NPC intracellular cholesterol transporter 2-like n=1 Tax=Sabethes cyaneus TaxID=53552 RepID=UPI00237D9B4C|nr:NPC intracellular cholesterol transporter 2-like [Sabethes cyaneus]
MFKFFLLAALVPAMVMAAVDFTACPNGAPTPSSLTVNDCSGGVCSLTAGGPVNALATGIVSPADSASATAHIVVRLGGLDVGFEIPAELEDACAVGIQGGCPLSAGAAFNYALNDDSLDVPARGVEVEIEVGLTGDGGVALGCLRFNAIIN